MSSEFVQVNMHEAKSKLSSLTELAHQGVTVVIAKAGKPYADLVPHKRAPKPRQPGRFKGKIRIADDFDKTPDELIKAFEGDL